MFFFSGRTTKGGDRGKPRFSLKGKNVQKSDIRNQSGLAKGGGGTQTLVVRPLKETYFFVFLPLEK